MVQYDFINRFKQAGPQIAVDLNRRINDLPANLVQPFGVDVATSLNLNLLCVSATLREFSA